MAALCLAAITAAAYFPVFHCGFIWDDDAYVTKNLTLRSPEGLKRIWFDLGATPQYYPLVHTSFWLEYRLWGLDPAGYHGINLLLYALSILLLWQVLRRLGLGRAAWIAAALFALHPVHVESVAWITERKNVLSGFFYVSALFAFLGFESSSGKKGWLYAGSLVLFLLALLSKTVTCTLPAVLLLLIWYRKGRIPVKEVLAVVPFFVMGLALGLVTLWMERHHVGALGPEWDLSFWERTLIAGRAFWFYLEKTLWPANLAFIYPRWLIDTSLWWQHLFPAAAVLITAALWWARSRISRAPLTAILFFAITLGPALGYVNVYPMRYSFVADHFQYLACLGPIALVAGLLCRVAERLGKKGRQLGTTLLVVVLALFTTTTWHQLRAYKNQESLWCHTLAINPDAWIGHTILAEELRSQGKLEKALYHFGEALRIQENLPLKIDVAQAFNNVGIVLVDMGRVEEGVRYYYRALEADPLYPMAHHNLGVIMRSKENLDQAVWHFRQALVGQPDHAHTYYNLADTLVMKGSIDEAIPLYEQALRLDPDHAQARENLKKVRKLRESR